MHEDMSVLASRINK